eukprot:763050-Hanusia_phi.AAC.3
MAEDFTNFKLKIGNTIKRTGRKDASQDQYETLLFTFRPDSIKDQSGVLWRGSANPNEKKKEGNKVYVSFENQDVAADGKASSGHYFEGNTVAAKDDCILIVDETTGEAVLEKISGSTRLTKLSKVSLPTSKPAPLPDSLKRIFSHVDHSEPAEERPSKAPYQQHYNNEDASSSDSSSDSSDDDDDDDDVPVRAHITKFASHYLTSPNSNRFLDKGEERG